MKLRNILLTGLLLIVTAAQAMDTWTIYSPDKRVKVDLMDMAHKLYYRVYFDNKELLRESPLGLTTGCGDFVRDVRVVNAGKDEPINIGYTMPNFKMKDVKGLYTGRTFTIENEKGKRMDILFRVGNNGVAFAYRLAEPMAVLKENTGFAVPQFAKAFLSPLAKGKSGWAETNPSYEDHYHVGARTTTSSDYGQGWVFPALFKVNDKAWMLISETGVDHNYVASHLGENHGCVYSLEFAHADNNLPTDPTYAMMDDTNLTPWRIVAIADNLNDIVRSTMTQDFVEVKAKDAAPALPGKASWSWLVYNDGYTTYEHTRDFVDMAAKLKLPYCLIDAQWDQQIGREKIKQLAAYAKQKGVGLLLWYNSNGNWNEAPQTPRDLMNNPTARKEEMRWLSTNGIKGIKVDFFGGDKQSGMQLYEDILKDAAHYGISVNFHGATLPRGWDKMFPNLASTEAVMGQEFCKFDQKNEDLRPEHCTVLPFTRNVVAPMDFTPTVLNPFLGEKPGEGCRRVTTAGFELALPVLFYSPVTHLGIVPDNVKKFPAFVWKYISAVPTTWDDTRLVNGYPGKDVVIARQKNGQWYIAGINGEQKDKVMTLDLSFLPDQTKLKMITTSHLDRNKVKQDLVKTSYDGKLSIKLQAYDGFVLTTE